ncbi:MAG: hypothetical protein LC792_21560 [Actinobacteria bacterium]|nr:hypothetical protein [Actinomycetota bacterium]
MRASLTIGGIEVALSASAGSLETAVAERYAPFLGAVETPVCSLTLEPSQAVEGPAAPAVSLVERVGETTFRVVHPGLFGWFDLAGAGNVHVGANPYALDNALRLLFGLLAPRHDALMLHATSVITNGGTHVFTGPAAGTSALTRLAGDRPVLTDGLVLVQRKPDGWLAASTPFWAAYDQPGPARDAKLSRLWSLLPAGAEVDGDAAVGAAQLAVMQHLYLPTAEPEIHGVALALATDLAETVPFSGLCFAGGPAAWAEVDAAAV